MCSFHNYILFQKASSPTSLKMMGKLCGEILLWRCYKYGLWMTVSGICEDVSSFTPVITNSCYFALSLLNVFTDLYILLIISKNKLTVSLIFFCFFFSHSYLYYFLSLPCLDLIYLFCFVFLLCISRENILWAFFH